MIDGYTLFRYYLSLKLHFTDDKFDIFKHRNPKTVSCATFSSYEKRKDIGLFRKFAKKIDDDRECVRFLVANFAHGNDSMIWSDMELAMSNLTKWNRNKQSLSKIFADDLDYLNNRNVRFDCTENGVIDIIKYWKSGKINIETICLLCQLEPDLIKYWKSTCNNTVYGGDLLRIEKLIPFVKMSEMIQNIWSEFGQDYFITKEFRNEK